LMERAPLKGSEVNAYVTCQNALLALLKPPVPAPPAEIKKEKAKE